MPLETTKGKNLEIHLLSSIHPSIIQPFTGPMVCTSQDNRPSDQQCWRWKRPGKLHRILQQEIETVLEEWGGYSQPQVTCRAIQKICIELSLSRIPFLSFSLCLFLTVNHFVLALCEYIKCIITIGKKQKVSCEQNVYEIYKPKAKCRHKLD